MKLYELSTDKALDVLCELTPYVANIVEDDEIITALDNVMPKDDFTSKTEADTAEEQEQNSMYLISGIKMIGGVFKITPILLKTHRPDVYGILSVLNEKTVDDIAAQPVTDTLRQLREAFQDNELVNFFKSYMPRARNAQSVPSADSPASE